MLSMFRKCGTIGLGIVLVGAMGACRKNGAEGVGESWATEGGNMERTGATTNRIPSERPAVLWRAVLEGRAQSEPVVFGGRVYVTCGSFCYAFDEVSGKEKWKFNGGIFVASPTVTDDYVYVGGWDQILHALRPRNGNEKWQVPATLDIYSSPAIIDDNLLFIDQRGEIFSVGAANGKVNWQTRYGSCHHSLAVSGGLAFHGTGGVGVTGRGTIEGGTLYAVDIATGALRWMFKARGGMAGTPAATGGRVFFGDVEFNSRGESKGTLYAIAISTGDRQWELETDGGFWSRPAVSNGTVYIGNENGTLYAVDAATGRIRWQYETGRRIATGAAVSQGTVFIGTDDGYVYALDARTGDEKWRLAVHPGPSYHGGLAIADGRLFTVWYNADGSQSTLYVLGESEDTDPI